MIGKAAGRGARPRISSKVSDTARRGGAPETAAANLPSSTTVSIEGSVSCSSGDLSRVWQALMEVECAGRPMDDEPWQRAPASLRSSARAGGLMTGKSVLVTGGSGGIGKATACGLAAMGAHVAIVGRDRARTEAAAREIGSAGGVEVDVFAADLSAQAEVRRLADEVLQRLTRVDVLINNVGGYWNTRHVTVDGLERTFAVNHLAPFLLTGLLLDRLKQGAAARVVTVSSNVQAMGRINFDDLQGESSDSGARAYNQSKLANVLFTYELARRLRGTSVTANALHPGVVRTSFGAEDPGRLQRVFSPVMRPFMKSTERGAATSIYVASDPDLEQVTGLYFANSKLKRSSKLSHRQTDGARLWAISTELVGLTDRH